MIQADLHKQDLAEWNSDAFESGFRLELVVRDFNDEEKLRRHWVDAAGQHHSTNGVTYYRARAVQAAGAYLRRTGQMPASETRTGIASASGHSRTGSRHVSLSVNQAAAA